MGPTSSRATVAMGRPIFVFGSNTQGRHGRGAALTAYLSHGAVLGQAEGLQGHSYAIPTKELRQGYPTVTLAQIRAAVQRFIEFANALPHQRFVVTRIGCGLAGFTDAQIAPMFEGLTYRNVELPREWTR